MLILYKFLKIIFIAKTVDRNLIRLAEFLLAINLKLIP